MVTVTSNGTVTLSSMVVVSWLCDGLEFNSFISEDCLDVAIEPCVAPGLLQQIEKKAEILNIDEIPKEQLLLPYEVMNWFESEENTSGSLLAESRARLPPAKKAKLGSEKENTCGSAL